MRLIKKYDVTEPGGYLHMGHSQSISRELRYACGVSERVSVSRYGEKDKSISD
ncbi:MAG: hypothetical protein H6Q68_2365 [Firmicutes bacterium]|nr:hypothetical protein [Bacillota bacterium]